MSTFGTIKTLDLRSLWPREAQDFTPWLAANIRELGDALGMELEVVETEAGVGDFALDILARDLGTDRNVIIENQYGGTDHDHLGKLLTYAAGFDASTLVWISETIREEHRSALEWLNQHSDANTQFFGVLVEVFQIDNSLPAFRFRPVVFPNEWSKGRRPPVASSSRAEAYRGFFQELIDELREKHKFTGARVGLPASWYSFASGFSGIAYSASFALGGRVRVELSIDQGDAEANKALFDRLAECRERLEAALGETLAWERLDERRMSRIALYRAGSIDSDEATLADIRSWMVEKLRHMKRVFDPELRSLRT